MDKLEELWVHYNDAIEDKDIKTYKDKSDIYRIYEADKVDKKIKQLRNIMIDMLWYITREIYTVSEDKKNEWNKVLKEIE